jgi:purine-binding chemotaxis protein CheW
MNQDPIVLNQAAILKTRARALAQEPKKAAQAGTFLEIIEFCLASETYGIEAVFVREIHPLKDLTPLPGVPAFVLGITNVRGKILSVVDLKKFVNLPDKGLGELNKMIIIRNSRMEFGILADAVLGARSVSLDTIEPLPATVTGIGADYVKGVTGEHVIILDAQGILDDERIIVNEVVA